MTHHQDDHDGPDLPEDWVPDPLEVADYACAVCGRSLDYARDLDRPGDEGYVHAARERYVGEDHPAVPVPRGTVPARDRCDVCLVDDPTWRLPTRPFEGPGGQAFSQDWLLCDDCARCVERDDWNGLVRRGVAAAEERHDIEMPEWGRAEFRAQYRLLRKSITGGLRRIGD